MKLVIDMGTTFIKAAVLDEHSRVLKIGRERIGLHTSEPGAAEHDPLEIVSALKMLSRRVVKGYEREIDVLVLSGYLFGLLPLGWDGRPLMRVVTWLDTRAATKVPEIKKSVDPGELYSLTGCPPLSVYQLPKLLWLRERRPGIYRRARYFLNIKDFIVYSLVGEPLGDTSTWSGSQLLNIHRLEWEPLSLELAGIDEGRLPELRDGTEIVGEVPLDVARGLGLEKSCELVLGVFDGASVAVGLGALREGIAAVNVGTSAMVRVVKERPILDSPDRMRFQTYHLFGRRWVPGGAISNAGVVLQWIAEHFLKDRSHRSLDALVEEASASPPASRGLLVYPFLFGERLPEIGSAAAGAVIGLRYHHDEGDFIRACMEGVAYSLRLIYDALLENGIAITRIRAAGGGAASDLWLEIIACVFNRPVARIRVRDAAITGASIIADIAKNAYEDAGRTDAAVEEDRTFYPSEEFARMYGKAYELWQANLRVLRGISVQVSM